MSKKTLRRPLVAGNWKMNKDHVEAIHLIADLGLRLRSLGSSAVDVSVHPPFTDLRSVEGIIGAESLPVFLGAQHCSAHEHGAYTGEVSVEMLRRLSVSYVIIGHSERRQIYSMSDADVAATTVAVHGAGMIPIICVGETQEEHEDGVTKEVLAHQVNSALTGIAAGSEERTVLAYEPIWAIGTGLAASGDDAQEVCRYLRSLLKDARGEVADEMRILYGGSAKPENTLDYVAQPDIDGLLVGGASLEGESFAAMIEAVATCYGSSAS